jgi:hypothetical protein
MPFSEPMYFRELTVQFINVHFAIGLWIPKDVVIVTNIAAYVVNIIINRIPQEVQRRVYKLS